MIYPVLLAGGSGTRLWPVSRKSYPKQFAPLTGDKSLFQSSVLRLSGPGFAAPMVLTGEDFRFIVLEQLAAIDTEPAMVLIEPEGRNTAPAVLAAALALAEDEPDALMLVAPSDHVIPDDARFRAAVEAGVPAAREGRLVTFGITPSGPETGYGYLRLAEGRDRKAKVLPLEGFVEKPDAKRAAKMVASGDYLWNAGIFLFSAKAILGAFAAHAPDMIAPVRAALAGAEDDLGFRRLDAAPWSRVQENSIDYAVMEKTEGLAVVPYDGVWSDLGGWDAVWRDLGPDAEGNVVSDHATAIDCRDSLLRSDSPDTELVGIGLKGMIAVATSDAVLVADKSRAQDVKLAVQALKEKSVKQAVSFPRDNRPWGWFETLALSDRFQVKRIVVKPGGKLSLQSHVHRAEHWIVVSGTAKVTVDDEVKLIAENQSIYIPLGAVHRMENPGKVPMVLIEVQTGAYLGEDDIVRYEDVYARS